MGRPQPAPADLPSVAARKDTSMIAFFSCKEGEYSWESETLGHGLFFAHLIGGLEGKADVNGTGQVTCGDLTGYVQKKVAETRGDRAQTPHFRADALASAQPLVVRAPTPRTNPGGTPPAPVPDPVPPPNAVMILQTITVNHDLYPDDPRIKFQLERIEVRSDHRMRWWFSYWNKRGFDVRVYLSAVRECYVTDDKGNRCDSLATLDWIRIHSCPPDRRNPSGSISRNQSKAAGT